MATLSQIRAGIVTRLDAIAGLDNHVNVTGTVNVPATVTTPAPGEFLRYATSYGAGTHDYLFVVTLFVARGDDPAGQDALDLYIDPAGAQSVRAAVQADPTLGGIVADCNTPAARNYGTFDYSGVSYFGCEFPVGVLA